MFIKYCVFSLNFVISLNSASSAVALVVYLPGVSTHTDAEGKQRKVRVRNIKKKIKKTQYIMNTLYIRANEWRIIATVSVLLKLITGISLLLSRIIIFFSPEFL